MTRESLAVEAARGPDAEQRSQGQPSSKPALIGFLCSLASPCLLLLGLVSADVSWFLFEVFVFAGVPASALLGLVLSLSALFFERARGVFRVLAIAGLVLSAAEVIGLVWICVLFTTAGPIA